MKRRKKNRKKQAQGFVFPVPLTLFLVMVTVISMTYLWMHGRCEAAGIRIQQLEQARQEAHQRLAREEMRWDQMKTLPNVRVALRRHDLQMDWAPNSRVVHLVRPVIHGDDGFLPVYGELAQLTGTTHE